MGTAWVGIVGTLIGTTLGAVLSWLAKRSEWNRQAQSRWDVDKRQAYVRFLMAGNEYEQVVRGLQASESNRANPGAIDRDNICDAFKELQASLTELLFFADYEVGQAAQYYTRLLVPAFATLPPGHSCGPYGWADVDFGPDDHGEDLVSMRAEFTAVARKDLALATPGILSTLPSGLDVSYGDASGTTAALR